MGEHTKIEWAHHTFNPWRGCSKVSAGCANCYAEKMSRRNTATLGVWGDGGTRVIASEWYWRQPLKWGRDAERAGERRRVFCASMADVFERREELVKPRIRLFDLIQNTPNLDWLLLTKRPQEVLRILQEVRDISAECRAEDGHEKCARTHRWLQGWLDGTPPSNIWLGTSVESQQVADERIFALLEAPAEVRFLSCEPLLGPLDLEKPGPWWTWLSPCSYYCDHDAEGGGHRPERSKIDWVIAGGESGPDARPCHPDWFRSLRDQCQTAGVPFFFKQWGQWRALEPFEETYAARLTGVLRDPDTPSDLYQPMIRVGKKAAGRLLDGREWNEVPEPK